MSFSMAATSEPQTLQSAIQSLNAVLNATICRHLTVLAAALADACPDAGYSPAWQQLACDLEGVDAQRGWGGNGYAAQQVRRHAPRLLTELATRTDEPVARLHAILSDIGAHLDGCDLNAIVCPQAALAATMLALLQPIDAAHALAAPCGRLLIRLGDVGAQSPFSANAWLLRDCRRDAAALLAAITERTDPTASCFRDAWLNIEAALGTACAAVSSDWPAVVRYLEIMEQQLAAAPHHSTLLGFVSQLRNLAAAGDQRAVVDLVYACKYNSEDVSAIAAELANALDERWQAVRWYAYYAYHNNILTDAMASVRVEQTAATAAAVASH